MPRNSQGLYTLPPGNPVTPGTLIEAQWANNTMSDVGSALTGSLPRDGSAPMTGQLTLADMQPTNGRHATPKAYVDKFVAYSTGMPVGSIMAYASGSLPAGFLLCDGTAISRTTYQALFQLIGTTYGAGDGATSFNLPDLRGYFVRGRDSSRQLGSKQDSALGEHTHPVNDPKHTHTFTGTLGTTGNMSANATHTHIATQAPHNHTYQRPFQAEVESGGGEPGAAVAADVTTSAQPAITVQNGNTEHTHQVTPAGTLSSDATGLTIGVSGASETRPQNIALDYYIKAINDSSSQIGVTSITSSDDNAIAIDETDPAIPELVVKTNVAFGLVKLNESNKIPANLMDFSLLTFLGTFDASAGQNPSEAFPSTTFSNGNAFVVSESGTIDVYLTDGTPVSQLVLAGWYLVYQAGLPTPDGWYFVEPESGSVTATNVSFTPVQGVTATNVQDAIAQTRSAVPDTASELPFVPEAGIISTDVQAAIVEVYQAVGGTPVASSVAFTPYGGISATNVQTALQEVDDEKAPKANPTFTGTVSGVAASMVANTPSGTVAATNVQDAINELDTEKIATSKIGVTGGVQAFDANTAKINVNQNWSLAQRAGAVTDNDLNFDLLARNNFKCTPVAGGSLTFTNIANAAGQSGNIMLDNTAAFVIGKAATVKTDSNFLAVINASGVYRLSYYCDGTNVYVVTSQAMS